MRAGRYFRGVGCGSEACAHTKLSIFDVFLSVQLEWLTGGECLAGMHEVVVTKRTLEAIELAKEQNRSLWRISSTVSTLSSHDVC